MGLLQTVIKKSKVEGTVLGEDLPCADYATISHISDAPHVEPEGSIFCAENETMPTCAVFEQGCLVEDVEVDEPEAKKEWLQRLKDQRSSLSAASSKHETVENLVNKDIFVTPYVSIERIKESPALVKYYTGLETFCKFLTAFYSLGPNVDRLEYFYSKSCDVPPITCFLIMLVYLRCHYRYPIFELARMFSVSTTTISNVCFTWIKFCAEQWREIDIWPSKKLVDFFCPTDFKEKFPNTRVILDGTEIPINRPSNPSAQRATFSTYKHRNTVKVLVGATPGGLVSYVSEAYGGSVSDRQMIERSNLLEIVEPGDVVMADKGFNVQDLFALKDVTVNTPTFFQKKNRMTPDTVAKDKKISSKRVHIERIIGCAKIFKILKGPLNARETSLASEIVFMFHACEF